MSLLEDCYNDKIVSWSDFNLVAITRDLMDGDYHRDGVIIEITDDTASWLEAVAVNSHDDDMQLIAKSLQLNFSITTLD